MSKNITELMTIRMFTDRVNFGTEERKKQSLFQGLNIM